MADEVYNRSTVLMNRSRAVKLYSAIRKVLADPTATPPKYQYLEMVAKMSPHEGQMYYLLIRTEMALKPLIESFIKTIK